MNIKSKLKKISVCEEPESDEWTDVVEYTYDENGIRTSMKAEGKTTYFIYEGNTLLAQYTDNGEKIENEMMFLYDENGEIQGCAVRNNGFFKDVLLSERRFRQC